MYINITCNKAGTIAIFCTGILGKNDEKKVLP
jgi:hypothetical protein